jgi:hypothetical protein
MKTKLNNLLLGSAPRLASAITGRALPPRQHSMSGEIEIIDFTNRTLILNVEKGQPSRLFVWNDSTRFSVKGAALDAEPLQPGRTVRVSYRREIGRLVLREVAIKSESSACCVVCC